MEPTFTSEIPVRYGLFKKQVIMLSSMSEGCQDSVLCPSMKACVVFIIFDWVNSFTSSCFSLQKFIKLKKVF